MAASISFIIFCFTFNAQVIEASEVDDDSSAIYLALQINNPNYTLYFWGQKNIQPLTGNDSSVKPVIVEERTMLPMRAVSRILNFDGPVFYDVEWHDNEKKASIFMKSDADPAYYEPVADFWIGRTTAVFYDGGGAPKQVMIPSAPVIINNRTYLPLRAIADALSETDIEWIPSKQGILIYFYGGRPSSVTFPDRSVHKLNGVETAATLPDLPTTLSFSSGAGAWSTELHLNKNGTFTGYFHDSNMGEDSEIYPNGTRYECHFKGSFKNIKKVNELEYSMQIESIENTVPEGDTVEDGVHVITSAASLANPPYGLDDAGEFILYLPGRSTSDLNEEFLSWWYEWLVSQPKTLQYFGLYNVASGQGFFG